MPIDNQIIPYAIPPLLSGFVLCYLGVFTYLKNPGSKVNLYFGLFLFVCALWQIGFAAMNVMKYEKHAYIFSRSLYTAVIMIPTFFYNFIVHFLNLRNRHWFVRIFYACSAVFICLLWTTRSFLTGNIHYAWGFSSRAGWIHSLYLIFFFYVFLFSFYELYRSYKNYRLTDPIKANRIKYILLASMIAVCGSTDYLSTYGIDYYPLGFVFMMLFVTISLYAIIKHKVLDIELVIKRGAVYSLGVGAISMIFMLLIVIAERLSQIYIGYSSLLFTFLAIILLSTIFIPLYNLLLKHLNKIVFKSSPDELVEQNTKLMHEVEKQDRMKSVATLAAGMAHEIKNPLTAIKTFTEHLPEKSTDPAFVKKFTNIVGAEVEKINSIVKQLLDFSKPSPLKFEKVNVNQILEETLELLNAEFLKYKIRVEKQLDNSIPPVNGDKKQLEQAFLNIFLNSIQAMPNGGTLTVSTSLSSDHCLLTSVKDTGSGIPKDQLPHIFDPFFTTKESGTGLGLSIVHGIIKEHGGKIEVESKIDQGTQFKILLTTVS